MGIVNWVIEMNRGIEHAVKYPDIVTVVTMCRLEWLGL